METAETDSNIETSDYGAEKLSDDLLEVDFSTESGPGEYQGEEILGTDKEETVGNEEFTVRAAAEALENIYDLHEETPDEVSDIIEDPQDPDNLDEMKDILDQAVEEDYLASKTYQVDVNDGEQEIGYPVDFYSIEEESK